MKVYRKVKIDDRHVGVYDVYFTSSGYKVFGVVYLEQSTCLWKCTANDGSYCYVTHTFEEIELPSDEELTKNLKIPFSWGSPSKDALYRKGVDNCYEFILNEIKGE